MMHKTKNSNRAAIDVAMAKRHNRMALVQAMLDQIDTTGLRTSPDDFNEFAKQRLYIRDKSGHVVRFITNSMQRAYVEKKRKAIVSGKKPKFLVLKYRRGGITTIEQGLSYKMAVTRRNTAVMTLAHTLQQTNRIFRIPKLMQERDPEEPRLGTRSKKEIEFADMNSTFFVGTAGGEGVSRGDTLQRVHGSEVSRWFMRSRKRLIEMEELMTSLTEAASHGEIVLETTPFGVDYFYSLYREAKRGEGDWTPIFLPWFDDPTNILEVSDQEVERIADTISESEQELIQKNGLTFEQIAWRRMKLAQPELRRLFLQEYPEDDESCFLRSGDPFFDVETAIELKDKFENGQLPRGEITKIPGGEWEVWEKPRLRQRYVGGVDTAEGLVSGDYCVLAINNFKTGKQAARLRGRWRPKEFAGLIVPRVKEYHNAFLGIEREAFGHAVIQGVMDLGYSSPSELFYLDHESDVPSRPGWATTGGTRLPIISELGEEFVNDPSWVSDPVMIDEMLSFHKQQNGKYEHDPGCHDDVIFANAIAERMRRVAPIPPQIMFA